MTEESMTIEQNLARYRDWQKSLGLAKFIATKFPQIIKEEGYVEKV